MNVGKSSFVVAAQGILVINFCLLLHTLTKIGNVAIQPGRARIDTLNFMAGVSCIFEQGSFWAVDLLYSPGYQLYLAATKLLVADHLPFFTYHRYMALIWAALTCALIIRIGNRYFGYGIGWLAAALLSSSTVYCTYVGLIQYEVLSGLFVCLLAACTLAIGEGKTFRAALASAFASGIWGLALAFIHPRFLPLTLLAALSIKYPTKKYVLRMACLLPLMLVGTLWSVHQTQRTGQTVIITARWDRQLKLGNNPFNDGFMGPVWEPKNSGIAYILKEPQRFVSLVIIRFFRCWGYYRDPWTVDAPWFQWLAGQGDSAFRKVIAVLSFWCVAGAIILQWERDRKKGTFGQTRLLYWLIICGNLAPLPFFGNMRYLVPFAPLISIFCAIGCAWAASWGYRAVSSFGHKELTLDDEKAGIRAF